MRSVRVIVAGTPHYATWCAHSDHSVEVVSDYGAIRLFVAGRDPTEVAQKALRAIVESRLPEARDASALHARPPLRPTSA